MNVNQTANDTVHLLIKFGFTTHTGRSTFLFFSKEFGSNKNFHKNKFAINFREFCV